MQPRLVAGQQVRLHAATLDAPLNATIERVEPYARTRLSSLGVEQQKVRVWMQLENPLAAHASGLGVGYRLQSRFIIDALSDALLVPRYSVLRDRSGKHYVMRIENDIARRVNVQLGFGDDLYVAIRSGLDENDTLVRTPDVEMSDGQRVSAEPDN